ncbi:MAG: dTDP-4-dehydrorhamnose 3,5-epimerase [Bdellovibrionales bacterium]|nr:dTDP-4-dehydrorhamnose 3,5-epimerase [Bdellovibrionales bacterium]
MDVQEFSVIGLKLIKPQVFEDKRGYFLESFNKNVYTSVGIARDFVQDNESFSARGTLRGLHFQTGDYAQAKLVRVISGEVLDVAVDLRLGSPTYGEHISVVLSGENKNQFFIPKGFAHGFVVLSDTAIFSYKCDQFYNPPSESGIIFNDPDLDIDWRIPVGEIILSDRDKQWGTFASYNSGSHRFRY